MGQGNIFRSVCQEFCSQGGGETWAGTPTPRTRYSPWDQVHPHEPGTPLGPGTPPRNRCPLPRDQVHPQDQVPPTGAVHAGRYGQQAGGTHPTGMHSCDKNVTIHFIFNTSKRSQYSMTSVLMGHTKTLGKPYYCT